MISQMTRMVATMLPPLLRVPLRMAGRYPSAEAITPARGGPSFDRVLGDAGDDLLAGRAEQHALEPAPATAADDEQVRIHGGVEQDRRGVAHHHLLGHPLRVRR